MAKIGRLTILLLISSGEEEKKLLKKGIIIRPGETWGCPNFIRVTIGTPYENQRFVQALKEVLNSLVDLRYHLIEIPYLLRWGQMPFSSKLG